jgi:hypothetical protein
MMPQRPNREEESLLGRWELGTVAAPLAIPLKPNVFALIAMTKAAINNSTQPAYFVYNYITVEMTHELQSDYDYYSESRTDVRLLSADLAG